ncbi:TPA: hypothetical protein ACH3X1_013499 [Trebouxia sp. C0004]
MTLRGHHLGLLLGALLLAVRVYALCHQGVQAQAPQLVGALPTAAASTSAAIAAANAATAAAANAMAGDGDTEMPAPSSGPGASPSALAPSQ